MSALALAQRPQETLTPLERLEVLCDPGLAAGDPLAGRPRGTWATKTRPGDGVVAGAGLVEGRPIFCYAQDATYVGGSLGEAHAETIVRVLRLAASRTGARWSASSASGGARMQEGVAGLGGYGRIFRETVRLSGKVPQISIITGLSAGGGAYSPALTDWVVMTRDSSMFLTGPSVVRDALGEEVSAEELGGTRVHQRNGVCHFVADERRRRRAPGSRAARVPAQRRSGEPAPGGRPPGAGPGSRRSSSRLRPVACTTCATSPAASSTEASCSRSRAVGRETSSPPSPGSTADRSA